MNWRRETGEFVLFTGGGALFGASVGFFFFLHLGFPSQPELSGYLSGLFVVAGGKVGLLGWFVRIVIRPFTFLVLVHSWCTKPTSEGISAQLRAT
jgi:hypothetical protein